MFEVYLIVGIALCLVIAAFYGLFFVIPTKGSEGENDEKRTNKVGSNKVIIGILITALCISGYYNYKQGEKISKYKDSVQSLKVNNRNYKSQIKDKNIKIKTLREKVRRLSLTYSDGSKVYPGNSTNGNISGYAYITPYGGKYHSYGCRYLENAKENGSIQKVSIRTLKSEGYEPCSVCGG